MWDVRQAPVYKWWRSFCATDNSPAAEVVIRIKATTKYSSMLVRYKRGSFIFERCLHRNKYPDPMEAVLKVAPMAPQAHITWRSQCTYKNIHEARRCLVADNGSPVLNSPFDEILGEQVDVFTDVLSAKIIPALWATAKLFEILQTRAFYKNYSQKDFPIPGKFTTRAAYPRPCSLLLLFATPPNILRWGDRNLALKFERRIAMRSNRSTGTVSGETYVDIFYKLKIWIQMSSSAKLLLVRIMGSHP